MTTPPTEPVTSPPDAPPRHVPALDGLRGLAALLVVVSHLSTQTGIGADLFQRGGGQLGVMLFFALSGFLMAHMYFGHAPTPIAVWRYGVARVARVVPLYLVVVLGSYALGHYPPAQACADGACLRAYDVTDQNLADHLFLRAGVSVLWTIPVEMRFYALFLVFWLAFAANRSLGTALIAGLLALYWLREPATMPVMKLGHYFLLGLIVWIAWRAVARRGRDGVWNALFASALAMLVASLPQPFIALHGHVPRMWWEPQVGVAVGLLLLASARSPLGGRLLGLAPLRWLGAVSYSLYLTHMLVLMNLALLLDPAARPLAFYAVAMAISLGLAALSHRWLERPAQAWLRKALDGRTQRTAPMEAHP